MANRWSDEDIFFALTMALRGPAAELLQAVDVEQQQSYNTLVLALEKRFGDSHMQPLYAVQLSQTNSTERGKLTATPSRCK